MTIPSRRLALTCLALFFSFAGCLTESSAQEENLERAMAAQERRMEGLGSLAEKLKGLVSWIPGVDGGEEEMDEYTEAMNAGAEVKGVKLEEGEQAGPAKIELEGGNGELSAEEAAALYRRNLQVAATKLNIAGALPKTKQILIGAQKLGVGERIGIAYDGNQFSLEILDITAQELKLKDIKSQLELTLEIGVNEALPPGMFRRPPPGMLPTMAPPGTPAPSTPAPALPGAAPAAAP